MSIELADRVALVTGGGSGLGRATCRALATEGVLVVAADVNAEGAKQTVAAIEADGGQARAIAFDVTDAADRHRTVTGLFDEFGERFGVLVNVAGLDRPGYFANLRDGRPASVLDQGAFEYVNQVNYLGPVALMSEFITGLLNRGLGGGEIVNVISLSAITIGTGAVGYNGSKAAFAKATEIAQREALEYDYPCRIQGLMPGAMNTPMLDQWNVPEDKKMDPAMVAAEIVHALRRPAGCYAQNVVITPITEPDWPR
jgi:NAD(P)-dependent dehydrogenase (short-subunit alcohol dehydrogenase family)